MFVGKRYLAFLNSLFILKSHEKMVMKPSNLTTLVREYSFAWGVDTQTLFVNVEKAYYREIRCNS